MDPFVADLFEVNDSQETFSDLKIGLELKVIFSNERYGNFELNKNFQSVFFKVGLIFFEF